MGDSRYRPVQQRKTFIDESLRNEHSMSELSRRFGVCRKTAYEWMARFLAGSELEDRVARAMGT